MFVELGEYGCQTFTDFREVADESGLYARLAGLLAGAGVPNVERALKEMLLEPILVPFRALCDAKLWRQVLGTAPPVEIAEVEIAPVKVGEPEVGEPEVGEPEVGELSGAKTVEASVVGATAPKAARFLEPDAAALEELEARWLQSVRAMKRFAQSRADEAPLLLGLRSRLERAIAAAAPDEMRAQLLAYALVADLGALGINQTPNAQGREWFDGWLLADALAEPLADLGAEPVAISEIGWWLLHLQSATPFALLMQVLADESAKERLKVNRFEGTLWFNAEGWQALHGALKSGAQFEQVELPLAQLDEAAKASGYRVVSWMEATRAPRSALDNGATAEVPKSVPTKS